MTKYMGKYMGQGADDMDVGVKAPKMSHGMTHIIREGKGKTVGIVTSQRGIGKDGLPVKGGGK
jgi:hypothetical protein